MFMFLVSSKYIDRSHHLPLQQSSERGDDVFLHDDFGIQSFQISPLHDSIKDVLLVNQSHNSLQSGCTDTGEDLAPLDFGQGVVENNGDCFFDDGVDVGNTVVPASA